MAHVHIVIHLVNLLELRNSTEGVRRKWWAIGKRMQHNAYLEKYRASIASLGRTAEDFAQSYAVAIRVTPTSLRGY
jgi:hypothetical protein